MTGVWIDLDLCHVAAVRESMGVDLGDFRRIERGYFISSPAVALGARWAARERG